MSLIDAVVAGDRRALARAITLVESKRTADAAAAADLVAAALPLAGTSVRVGVSGTPGVGKSTFLNVLGIRLVATGRRVAVLAVDPTSQRTGGSILGDKTRMGDLARSPAAYIRPSPAGRTLGGVARRTREAMLLCEAAGFDVVLVETVGVGQSEVAVAGMVDTFVLLLAPGGGDELQGIKRGVMELADIVVVNKADGSLLGSAQHAAADHRAALHLLRPTFSSWTPEVLLASAANGAGIDEMWETVGRHAAALRSAGDLARLRASQAAKWLWDDVTDRLLIAARDLPAAAANEAEVVAGRVAPSAAATAIVAGLLGSDAAHAG